MFTEDKMNKTRLICIRNSTAYNHQKWTFTMNNSFKLIQQLLPKLNS